MGTKKHISRSTIQDLDYSAPDQATVGNTTTVLLAENASRKYACIVNEADEEVYLAFGASAVMHKGIYLAKTGGSFELIGANMTTQAVNGICSTGGKIVTVQEAI